MELVTQADGVPHYLCESVILDPFNPFAPPGAPRNPFDGIFAPPRRGGGGARPRPKPEEPAPASEPYGDSAAATEEKEEARPAEEKATLTDVRFAKDMAGFGEVVTVSAQVALPKGIAHLTRVEFLLYAADAEKGSEPLAKAEGHAKDGKATASFTLPAADGKAKEREYACAAKHKHSEETKGNSLKAKGDAPADLEIEIEDGAAAKKEGHAFRIKDGGGKVAKVLQAKDGIEKAGKLTLRFEKLDPSLTYTLECLDSKGGVLGAIFSNRKFGEWTP